MPVIMGESLLGLEYLKADCGNSLWRVTELSVPWDVYLFIYRYILSLGTESGTGLAFSECLLSNEWMKD